MVGGLRTRWKPRREGGHPDRRREDEDTPDKRGQNRSRPCPRLRRPFVLPTVTGRGGRNTPSRLTAPCLHDERCTGEETEGVQGGVTGHSSQCRSRSQRSSVPLSRHPSRVREGTPWNWTDLSPRARWTHPGEGSDRTIDAWRHNEGEEASGTTALTGAHCQQSSPH